MDDQFEFLWFTLIDLILLLNIWTIKGIQNFSVKVKMYYNFRSKDDVSLRVFLSRNFFLKGHFRRIGYEFLRKEGNFG